MGAEVDATGAEKQLQGRSLHDSRVERGDSAGTTPSNRVLPRAPKDSARARKLRRRQLPIDPSIGGSPFKESPGRTALAACVEGVSQQNVVAGACDECARAILVLRDDEPASRVQVGDGGAIREVWNTRHPRGARCPTQRRFVKSFRPRFTEAQPRLGHDFSQPMLPSHLRLAVEAERRLQGFTDCGEPPLNPDSARVAGQPTEPPPDPPRLQVGVPPPPTPPPPTPPA